MITLEDRIRDVLASQAAAMPMDGPGPPSVSDAAANDRHASRHRRWPVLIAAAAVALIAVGAVVTRWSTSSIVTPNQIGTFVAPTSGPESTTDVPPTSNGPVAIVIPPRESAADDRDPLQRVLGVPSDVTAANRLSHDQKEQAIRECMNANGFDYTPAPFADDPAAAGQVDANQPYIEALPSDERLRYLTVRSGGPALPADQSCEAIATRRVFLFNAYPNLHEELDQRLSNDPRLAAARAQVAACITAAGQDPQLPNQPARPECETAANWTSVSSVASDDAETGLIQDHAAELTAFIAQLPTPSN